MKRGFTNLFIAVLLLLLLVDGLPATHYGHRRLKTILSPVVSRLGLWQWNWRLFAPNPDHINTWIEAKVTFSDQSVWTWKTPDWQTRELPEKFIQGKLPKFWDLARMDDYKQIWPYLADYAVRLAPRPSNKVTPLKVELSRHWWDIPPPGEIQTVVKQYGQSIPPREKFPNEYPFYLKVLP